MLAACGYSNKNSIVYMYPCNLLQAGIVMVLIHTLLVMQIYSPPQNSIAVLCKYDVHRNLAFPCCTAKPKTPTSWIKSFYSLTH